MRASEREVGAGAIAGRGQRGTVAVARRVPVLYVHLVVNK
jgi:hypothetical protein